MRPVAAGAEHEQLRVLGDGRGNEQLLVLMACRETVTEEGQELSDLGGELRAGVRGPAAARGRSAGRYRDAYGSLDRAMSRLAVLDTDEVEHRARKGLTDVSSHLVHKALPTHRIPRHTRPVRAARADRMRPAGRRACRAGARSGRAERRTGPYSRR